MGISVSWSKTGRVAHRAESVIYIVSHATKIKIKATHVADPRVLVVSF